MGLGLGIDPKSKAGALYQDVKSEYIKSKMGTEEDFKKEISKGCTDSFMFIPVHSSDPKCGLAEIAYKYDKFHPYLVKHGYPLPIGMNDYNPETKIDDKLRQEIDSFVQKVESEMANEGLVPGTKDYVCKAARRIYDWGVTRLAFTGDCNVEPNDWEAMKEGCGFCSETSAIIHYALSQARLNPKFMYVDEYEPTIANYNKFANFVYFSEMKGIISHVFNAIKIPDEEKLLHIDVAQKLFDAGYEYAKEITPRQFVLGWHYNRIADYSAKENSSNSMDTVDSCLAISIEDPLCIFDKLSMLQLRSGKEIQKQGVANKETIDEFDKFVRYVKKSGFSVQALSNIIALIVFFNKGDFSRFKDTLEKLNYMYKYITSGNYRDAAKLSLGVVLGLQRVNKILELIAQRTKISFEKAKEEIKHVQFNLLTSALNSNPDYINAYFYLKRLDFDQRELYEAFSDFSIKHPEISLAHFFKANYGLAYASSLPKGKEGMILKEVNNALIKVDELEQNSIGAPILKSNLSILQNRTNEAIKILEKSLPNEIGPLSFESHWLLMSLYMDIGNLEKFREAVNRVMNLSPNYVRDYMVKRVYGLLDSKILRGIEKFSEFAAIGKKMGKFLDCCIWLVGKISEEKYFEGMAKQLYAKLFIYTALFGETEKADELALKLGDSIPTEVKIDMDALLDEIVGPLLEKHSNEKSDKYGLRVCDYIINKVDKILTPAADFPGFTKLLLLGTKIALFNHNIEKAKEFIKRLTFSNEVDNAFYEYFMKPLLLAPLDEQKTMGPEDIKLIGNLVEVTIFARKELNWELVPVQGLLFSLKKLSNSVGKSYRKDVEILIKRVLEVGKEGAIVEFLGNDPFKDPLDTAIRTGKSLRELAVIKWKQMIVKKFGNIPEEYKKTQTYDDFVKSIGLDPNKATITEITEKVNKITR